MSKFDDLKREEEEATYRASEAKMMLDEHISLCTEGCGDDGHVTCYLGKGFEREFKLAFKEYQRAKKAREK